MTVIEKIHESDAGELTELLYSAIAKCTGKCPALGQCRNGIGCRAALCKWIESDLTGDEEWIK